MARANRALRRAMRHRPGSAEARALQVAHLERRVRTLPGLPGGPPYVPDVERERVMEEVLGAVSAMTPAMAFNADRGRRGLPGVPVRRLRLVSEVAPGGLGAGVVLGEVTSAPVERPSLVLPRELNRLGLEMARRNRAAVVKDITG